MPQDHEGSAAPRPRQVGLSAWLIVLGSGGVLLSVYDALQNLHSLSSQSEAERMLRSVHGTGLRVDDVLDVMHVLDLIAAGCATACLLLGFYVLRRERGARIALSILAVPLFLAGLSADGIFSTLVTIAIAWLWSRPAREWFDASGASTDLSTGSPSPSAPPVPPPAQRPNEWSSLPMRRPVGDVTTAPAPPAREPVSSPAADRPRIVVAAALIVWICTVISAVLMIVGAGLVIHEPHRVLHTLLKENPSLGSDGLNATTVRGMVLVVAAIVIAWCAGAATLAALVWRRIRWALKPLVISTVISALFLLFSILTNPLAIVPLLCAAVTIRLLLRAEVRAWLKGPVD